MSATWWPWQSWQLIYGENDKHVGLTQTHPAQQRDLKDLKGKWWVQTYRLNTTWRRGRETSGNVSSSHGTSQDGRATKLWVPSLSIRLNLTSVRSCHGRRKQCTPKNHPQRGQLTSCPAGRRHFSNPNWLNRKFCWSRSHVLDSEKIPEKFNLCLRGGLGWWFGSLGIDGFVNLEKTKNIKPCKQWNRWK